MKLIIQVRETWLLPIQQIAEPIMRAAGQRFLPFRTIPRGGKTWRECFKNEVRRHDRASNRTWIRGGINDFQNTKMSGSGDFLKPIREVVAEKTKLSRISQKAPLTEDLGGCRD